ncbi:molybdopterin-binding protein [Limibaculum sp. FT325]|uniref:competence/damage-inducible protein A n=1 Tax=Thermohalobaculum sediminis TaxID=2939436 RepID=UPI0020C0AA80|nr:molybdopterin-binding protein [Limibaculum sediminis]MCL5776074.1 molybdopterin-binding protein [Limibaculum sediminis]
MTQPTAAMLVIGDEILSGRTRDANAHLLAQRMTGLGIRLVEIRVIPDIRATIVASVRELSARVTYLFTSGGIGPTHDDITADAVAEAFGAPIGVRDDARAILEAYYKPGELNEARLRMARIPEGATLIDNPLSHAPGFVIGNCHVMAGVPSIFAVMLEGLAPRLVGGPPILSHSFRVMLPEGELAEPLGRVAAAHPDISIGCYPFFRLTAGATIILRGTDPGALARAADEMRAMLAARAPQIEETPPGAATEDAR